jgi:CheY-like chemotaxis protein
MVKILIMDDEPGLRSIIFNMLKPLGHPMFTAEDGHQAIEIAKREIPDLAMLDMRVPDMDGLEVLSELKKVNPKIKAIMLSGFGDVETAVEALKRGAFEYLSKPFKVDEVLATVNKALQVIQGEGAPAPAAAAPAPIPVPIVKKPPIAEPVKKVEPVVKKAPEPMPQPVSSGAPRKMAPIAMIAGALVAVLAIGVFVWQKGLVGQPASEAYALPYSNVAAICWIRPYMWVTDSATGNIYKHNRDGSLSIDSIYKTDNKQPTGLTYDGQFIWTSSADKQRIYKHRVDNSLTIDAAFATPNNPSNIYFDSGNLWVMDARAAKIYKHKLDETLSPEGVFNSPVSNPSGMFRNGESLYIGDYKTGKIYKVSASDFAVNEVYAVPNFTNGKYKLASITWDGKNIWATAEGTGKVLKIPFTSLKPIEF